MVGLGSAYVCTVPFIAHPRQIFLNVAFALRALTALATAATAPALAATFARFAWCALRGCICTNGCDGLCFCRFYTARRTRRAILTPALVIARLATFHMTRAMFLALGSILRFRAILTLGPGAARFTNAARLIAIAGFRFRRGRAARATFDWGRRRRFLHGAALEPAHDAANQ